jgi:hypothetical protein
MHCCQADDSNSGHVIPRWQVQALPSGTQLNVTFFHHTTKQQEIKLFRWLAKMHVRTVLPVPYIGRQVCDVWVQGQAASCSSTCLEPKEEAVYLDK